MTSVRILGLNHAVLYVRDAAISSAFYQDVLGFEVVESTDFAVFLRANGSANHHDLALFSVGAGAPIPPDGSVRLYHLAWQVESIHDLVGARQVLSDAGSLVGESDHGATKSLYAKDPDGYEFEIMYLLPRDQWGEYESRGVVMPLDLAREVAKHG